ncbi:MAG: hypothetical protein ACE10H_10555, partial [Candidatus Binatia bacterium]
YTLLLKNGRSITVKRYREEGGIIKVYGLGWEMGFSRDQIESIIRVEKGERQRAVLPDLPVHGTQTGAGKSAGTAVGTRRDEKVAPPGHLVGGEGEEKKDEPVDMKGKAKTPEELRAEERAKEEKKYQKRVREITTQIKTLMDRYSLATGRGAGPEPSLLNSEEAIKGRTADLMSRLRDRQYNPAGPSRVELFTGGSKTRELRRGVARPRVRVPLPAYSAKEKELSNLRAQTNQLRTERETLIQEMRRKKFDTGSLFLE